MNLLGALGVAGVLGGLAYGLPAWDDALPSDRPVRADTAYPIAEGVSVVPPPGAVLDVTATRPGGDEGTVLFGIGPVRYAIAVRPYDGDLAMAAARLRQRITENPGYQVTGGQSAVTTSTGLEGVQGGYTAPGRGGRYAVYLVDGRTIEVTISGSAIDLGRTLPAIEASVRTLRYTG